MPRKGEGVCEAVVIVAMWHGNSWRFCVSFSSQMSPKIWKIFKIIPTVNDTIFSEENDPKNWTPWWWLWWCEITVKRQEDGGRKVKKYAGLDRTTRYVQIWACTPQKAVWRCLSVETKKKSKYPNIGTWYVPTYQRMCVLS